MWIVSQVRETIDFAVIILRACSDLLPQRLLVKPANK